MEFLFTLTGDCQEELSKDEQKELERKGYLYEPPQEEIVKAEDINEAIKKFRLKYDLVDVVWGEYEKDTECGEIGYSNPYNSLCLVYWIELV